MYVCVAIGTVDTIIKLKINIVATHIVTLLEENDWDNCYVHKTPMITHQNTMQQDIRMYII